MPLQPTGHAGLATDIPGIVSITTGAAHTKGAWTTLIPATSAEMGRIRLVPNTDLFLSANARGYLADIGVGGTGSELVIAADINWGSSGQGSPREILCRIPAGSRVVMRAQSVAATITTGFYVVFDGRPVLRDCPEVVTTYGANTASSAGTAVAPGGTNNVFGSWVTITSATTRPIRWLAASIGISTTSQLFTLGLLEIGVGSEGQETVLDGLWYRTTAAEQCNSYGSTTQIDLPAGVRLAARTRQDNVTGPIGVVLHGMD